ncbi:GNAT family N-acetyltransferase [Flavobacterium branchiicola]|uniref:GNAT family N-acetyltransferase n=1 Tax=Flavobacterium branchiicola TaxID=1114875 RepID=A0ABV9PC90_9FLAO|nr:GNAT family N-acetyltransferase [Flavobacterium branchiicola]MBS7254332.1 GNAT family N-acetyltransferase [Flavobacterium branchiicola]
MKKPIETERLFLREFLESDVEKLFEMESNPNVHVFVGKKPLKRIDQAFEYIQFIQQQYKDHGTGRWAVILKETNEFIGWSGIKFITNEINNHKDFYEIGYRFNEKHWGKGYATEAGKAFVDYAFNELKADALYAYADAGNDNSRKILEKLGLKYVNNFEYEEEMEVWYELKNPNL